MDDLISRQAAIDELDTGLWGVEWDKALATAILKDLPSAEPETAERTAETAQNVSDPVRKRQVIVTWYDPAKKLPPEDECVVITFSGRRNISNSYIHALGIGVYYEGDGWLIDGMSEAESDRMTIEAWADLDP